MNADRVRDLIRQQFAIAAELTMLTARPFTLDGHAIGSAGEVLAKIRFGLELTDPSTEGVDARRGSLTVEIKTTGGTTAVALRGLQPIADQLLVLQLDTEGREVVVYNGPAQPVWDAIRDRPMQSNGQRKVSLAHLRALQQSVLPEQMLAADFSHG
jgi:hypothetical protein